MSGGLLKYEGAADGKKYADRWRMARARGSVRTKERIAEIDEKIKRQREADDADAPRPSVTSSMIEVCTPRKTHHAAWRRHALAQKTHVYS